MFFLILFLLSRNKSNWGLGIGDWGLGIGVWAQSPIPIYLNKTFSKKINSNNFIAKINYK